jgi:hypothetical protein
MERTPLLLLFLLTLLAPVADACTRLRTVPPEELVTTADAIYHVKAMQYVPGKSKSQDLVRPWASTIVRFSVVESLKGPKATVLSVHGELVAKDDPNDQTPPYTFVRPGGRRGNCYADTYRRGADYLLFIKGGKPYWSPLAPTTEQLFGANDPWLQWVKSIIKAQRPNNSFKPNQLRGSA